jgi:hypothetical protein
MRLLSKRSAIFQKFANSALLNTLSGLNFTEIALVGPRKAAEIIVVKVSCTERRLRRRCPQLSCTDCSRLLTFARAFRWAAPFFSRRQLVSLVDAANLAGLDRDAGRGQCADHLERRRDLGGAPQGLPQDLDGLLERGLAQDPLTLQPPTDLLGGPLGVGADVQVLAPIALTANAPPSWTSSRGGCAPAPEAGATTPRAYGRRAPVPLARRWYL